MRTEALFQDVLDIQHPASKAKWKFVIINRNYVHPKLTTSMYFSYPLGNFDQTCDFKLGVLSIKCVIPLFLLASQTKTRPMRPTMRPHV